jgi:hypothetical protein
VTESVIGVLIDTLRLGAEPDGDLAARWRRVDTRNLPDLIAYEGAAIWLIRRLRAGGILDVLPAAIGQQLRQQAIEDAALRMEVEVEAAGALTLLNRAKIPVILMKGIARCALAARYPFLDARRTTDVDLLVPLESIQDADLALRADGYVPVPPRSGIARRHHHLPPLHKGRITVELHQSVSMRVPSHVAWERASDGSELVQWAGLNVQVPSATELAWNAAAHAMEDDDDGFRLYRFLELAALVNGNAPIDWALLTTRSATHEAFDADAGVLDRRRVVYNWIAGALALVPAERRANGMDLPGFDLHELLTWRLDVFRVRSSLGRAFAGRLLVEGTRSIVGMPLERSPATASRWGRIRRGVAANVSRAALRGWRATRAT